MVQPTFNLKELLKDSEALCDGLFIISSTNELDSEILDRMRLIAQKFNKVFSSLYDDFEDKRKGDNK
jgi:hypothetical protein